MMSTFDSYEERVIGDLSKMVAERVRESDKLPEARKRYNYTIEFICGEFNKGEGRFFICDRRCVNVRAVLHVKFFPAYANFEVEDSFNRKVLSESIPFTINTMDLLENFAQHVADEVVACILEETN